MQSEDFITLIAPTPSECEYLDILDVLVGGEFLINGKKYEEQGYIFDHNFVDDTITQEKTFVFVETDIDTVRDNMFVDFNLYVCIFSSKNLIRLNKTTSPTVKQVKDMGYYASTYGNRIEILCDIVDRILNGSNDFESIGEVTPAPRNHVTIYAPNSKYYGKCLKYKITNYNERDDDCQDN